MGLGTIFSGLFGRHSGASADAGREAGEPVEYQGYLIIPEPIVEGGQYRTAGRIRQGEGEQQRESRFIRADVASDADSAREHAIVKARQIIDEQGERLFDREML